MPQRDGPPPGHRPQARTGGGGTALAVRSIMPEAPLELDHVVIGAGVAGRAIAQPLARAGAKVALVERRAFGGTCELRGCEPKKRMWEVAATVDRATRLQGRGITGRTAVDWPALAREIARTTAPVPDQVRQGLEKTVAFTHPPAAQVGARADELADALRAGDVERRAGDASGWQTAERAGETVYAYEVLVDRGSNELRGATVVGPQAEETIHLFALAMAEGIPASRLAALLPAFPTAASDLSALLSPDT